MSSQRITVVVSETVSTVLPETRINVINQAITGPLGNDGADGPPGADSTVPGPAGADGLIVEIVAGTNITVDDTDPAHPIVSATSGGSVDSVNGATGVVVLDAGDIAFTPAGSIAATDVQAAIEEVMAEAGGGGAVDSVNTQTGVVVLDADDIDDTSTTNKWATAAELSKLSGIEALADVTDATNVAAAGAVMTSGIGSSVQAYDADLAALAAISSNGLLARTGSGTASARTITGTTNLITVTNGDGVSGNPTITVGANVYTAGGTDVPITDGGTGASTKAAAFNALSPMTTLGDIIIGDTSGAGIRLAKGSDGQVLKMTSGQVAWGTDNTGGGGVSDGDYGDITISGSGAAYTIDAGAVTLAKMANLAQDQFIGRTTASTGVPETATITAAARTVLDDTTVSAMVDTLGGTAAQGTGAIVRATSPTLTTPNLGTPSAATLTNATGLPVAGITASTSTALGVGSIELGHASDTTIARVSAGLVSIEGVNVVTVSATQTLTNKTLTSPTLTTPALGTPASGTLTNATGLPIAGLVASTSTAIGVGSVELGHATDTTLSRSAAGVLAVEGVVVPTISSTSTLTNKTISTGSVIPVVLGFALSDETTALTTGAAKLTVRMPYAMTLTSVRANLNTVSSSGLVTVDINEGGSTIMTTNKLSIDASEKTSTTAATAHTLTDTALADDAEITFDIDAAGTGAKGLKVWLIGTRTL